ncbi:MAG: T9SS type A sorting domain-containing protein [Gemmatimonadota bacterium]|nr:MAG: T9SS type A sorting domain-containing protein [Gemmatimonadota bacterium]
MLRRILWIAGIVLLLLVQTFLYAQEKKSESSSASTRDGTELGRYETEMTKGEINSSTDRHAMKIATFTVVRKGNSSESQLTLEGQLHFAGTPMSTLTSVQPSFWFRDEVTGMEYPDATTTYNSANGNYTFSNLPSKEIGISISFHTTGSEDSLPGNYRTWIIVDLSLLSESERRNYDIRLQQIMHVTQPWDNNSTEFSMGEPYPAYLSPVTFSWDSIPSATRYQISIYKYRDSDHPSGYGLIELALGADVSSSSYSASLEESSDNEHYEFSLYAYKDFELVGYYMTTYTAGVGWDFRFKITKGVKVEEEDVAASLMPSSYSLSQNYPNPFNPKTDIRYQIPAPSRSRDGIGESGSPVHTTLKIYNILGQEVRTLVDEVQQPGYYTVTWDGRNSAGSQVVSGVYLYRIESGPYSDTRRMVLLR